MERRTVLIRFEDDDPERPWRVYWSRSWEVAGEPGGSGRPFNFGPTHCMSMEPADGRSFATIEEAGALARKLLEAEPESPKVIDIAGRMRFRRAG